MKRNIGIALALSLLVLPACSKDKKKGDEKAATSETGGDTKVVDNKTDDKGGDDKVAVPVPGASNAEVAALLKHFPADTEILVNMNLQSLTGTPLWKQFGPAAMAQAPGNIRDAEKHCGFDPVTTLKSVHLAINSARDDEPVVLVRGLTREPLIKCIKAIAALEKSEVAIADEGSFTTITGKGKDETQGLAWINADTMVLVPGQINKEYLQARIDGKDGLNGNADFGVPAAKANQAAPIWFAGQFGESSKAAKGMGAMGSQPKAVYGSLGFQAGFQLAVGVTFADEKAAAATVAQVKPQLGMAKGFLGPAGSLVDKVEMGNEGADMKVSLSLTEAEVEQLTSMAGAMMPKQ
jgi:hypothetical protein